MVRRIKIFVAALVIVLELFSLKTQAQYVLKQAKDESSLYNYAKAIPLYEKAYKKKQTAEAARGAADGYYKQRDFVAAELWYAKLIALKDHTPQDEFNYAQSLMNNAKYAEAKELLIRLDTSKTAQNDTLISHLIAGCDSAAYWMQHPLRGSLTNVYQLNSAKSDWGAANYKGDIIFASDRPTALKKKQPFFRITNISTSTYGWTGDSYQHLYSAKNNDSSSIAIMDTTMINGYYHTASASFTADGKEMFFASTRFIKKKAKFVGKEQPYTINIEIYYTARDSAKNKWSEPKRFPYNDILQNSLGDPFISPDGQTLYFTSDIPGQNFGGTDIYYSKRINDTGWAAPVNMGSDINTAGNERTPFFDDEGNFYFASDGHVGMGGLDIYKASPEQNDKWNVVNAGDPINSPQDDLTPFFTNGYHGYFTSNRPSGKGSDDIYQFEAARILIFKLEGEVLHKKTNEPISNAEVTLTNLTAKTPVTAVTHNDGTFSFILDSVTAYELGAAKPDYTVSATESLTTVGLEESTVIHKTLYLDSVVIPIVPAAPIVIENIYYNFDRSNIRPDAINPLDHIVELMKENANWHLDISSYTDSRGSDSYNMKLSERRAQAALQYLIAHGIDADRLTAQGYGETMLVNNCSNGVPCSEKEHQLNRRSEFKVSDK